MAGEVGRVCKLAHQCRPQSEVVHGAPSQTALIAQWHCGVRDRKRFIELAAFREHAHEVSKAAPEHLPGGRPRPSYQRDRLAKGRRCRVEVAGDPCHVREIA
jgi:hypothetical protein